MEQIFDIPYIVAVVLTFAIVIIYSMLGGFDSVTTIAFFQVILIVAVAIIAPILVYLNTGISPIYEGMLKLAPEKLDILLPAGLFFTFGVSMMAIGEVFMDNTFWQRAFAIDKNKIGRIFVLSGIGWAFVPVAVSTLAFVALGTNQMPENVNQVAPFIAKVYGGNFVAWLFLVCVWSALASTIAAVLNSLVSLFINDIYLKIRPNASNKSSLTTAKVVTVLIGLVGLLLSLPKLLTMLGMLMFLGVINAAYIFPIVFGLFWKKVSSNAAFAGATLAVIGGYIVYFTVGPIEGCVVSSFISFVATLAISLAKPANFDWETLKK